MLNVWQVILLVCFGVTFIMNWIVQPSIKRFLVVAVVLIFLMFCVVMV